MGATAYALSPDLRPELIEHAIRQLDFNRAARGTLAHGRGFKEWNHFTVHTPGLDLILNLSVSDGFGVQGERTARLIALARSEGWCGTVQTFASDEVAMPGGRVGQRFGSGGALWAQGKLHLTTAVPALDLDVDLRLEPLSLPAALLNVRVNDGPPINWVVLPRLAATGTVSLAGKAHRLVDAPAYHDHNFGKFHWGSDFAWEWGYALPLDPASPWAIVLVRFQNRARTRVMGQQLLVWRRGRPARFFVNRDLSFEQHGLLRPTRVLKVPAPMALLRPGLATDVPERVVIHGSHPSGDWVRCEVSMRDVAQILVPNERGLGLTTIQEVKAQYDCVGTVSGEPLELRGEGTYELLGP